jgi:hypothetical protein
MAIRFHLDENVSGAVARALKSRGIDVSTAMSADLLGAADLVQLQFAHTHDRVLVTHDDDFTQIHANGTPHAGICYCHKEKYSVGDLVRLLQLVRECVGENEMRGHLEYL